MTTSELIRDLSDKGNSSQEIAEALRKKNIKFSGSLISGVLKRHKEKNGQAPAPAKAKEKPFDFPVPVPGNQLDLQDFEALKALAARAGKENLLAWLERI